MHPQWEVTWWREEPWTLPELAEVIPKGWRIPAKPTTPEGRNVTLFRAAMRWFGRPSNWGASTDLGDVHAWIAARNAEWFDVPLDDQECYWMAKSVCKISRKKPGRAARRSRISASSRRPRAGGRVKCGARGVSRRRHPGRPEGVSRPTWYRHRAGQHTGPHGDTRRFLPSETRTKAR